MMQQKLDQYQIEEQIGEGAFAWVYRALDTEEDRPVALKVLKQAWLNDPKALERFRQEAKIMRQLQHRNIVPVYGVGQAMGQVYLVQHLVEGWSLAAWIKERGPLTWKGMLSILQRLAAALDYAHEKGVIHRDIKPANILLSRTGSVYLSDFGLVRAAEGSVSLSSSMGGMIGTPPYMSPEQWGSQEVNSATDVYALSCVVVEMLTGQVLFNGPTPPIVMKQHLLDGPQLPSDWPKADVPLGLPVIIQDGLAQETETRIQRAGELFQRLSYLTNQPEITIPQPSPLQTKPLESAAEESPVTITPEQVADPVVDSPAPRKRTSSTRPLPPAPKRKRGAVWTLLAMILFGVFITAIIGLIIVLNDRSLVARVQLPAAFASPTPTLVFSAPGIDQTVVGDQSDEEFAKSYNNRGVDYYNAGQYNYAIDNFNQALRFKPDFAIAYANRGLANFSIGNYELAILDYNQAIDLDPEIDSIYYNRGITYQTLGQDQQAIADYQKVIEISTDAEIIELAKGHIQELQPSE